MCVKLSDIPLNTEYLVRYGNAIISSILKFKNIKYSQNRKALLVEVTSYVGEAKPRFAWMEVTEMDKQFKFIDLCD